MSVFWFGEGVLFFWNLSALPRGSEGGTEGRDAGHKPQFASRARHGGRRGDFLLLCDIPGPIPALCWSGSKLSEASRSTDPYFLFQTKHSLEESDNLAKGIPDTKRALPAVVNARGPRSEVPPLHEAWNCVPAVAITGHRSSSVPHHWVLHRELETGGVPQHRRDLAFRSKIEWLLEGATSSTWRCAEKPRWWSDTGQRTWRAREAPSRPSPSRYRRRHPGPKRWTDWSKVVLWIIVLSWFQVTLKRKMFQGF